MSESDSIVLKAIQDNNMIFVSAQPDTTYFHWQVELYLYQFSKHNILDRCYALFGHTHSPSAYVINLAKKYPNNIKFYKDERVLRHKSPLGTTKSVDYVPSIRPHILAKFFAEYPNLGKTVFYHDSDIFLVKLPKFDYMLQPLDKTAYVSNTLSYIGYEYIKKCSIRYKEKYPSLPDEDIFYGMCKIVDIDPKLVIDNQNNSGGAQYLLKDIDADFWRECEKICYELYAYLSDYEKKHPIDHHIQKWTTDMWAVLWLYWKRGGKTLIHKELDFSWGTGTVDDYNRLNIFHLAGVTKANSSDKFHKGLYTSISVFDAYKKNPTIFDHISKQNATSEYVNVIKEYMQIKQDVVPRSREPRVTLDDVIKLDPEYSRLQPPSTLSKLEKEQKEADRRAKLFEKYAKKTVPNSKPTNTVNTQISIQKPEPIQTQIQNQTQVRSITKPISRYNTKVKPLVTQSNTVTRRNILQTRNEQNQVQSQTESQTKSRFRQRLTELRTARVMKFSVTGNVNYAGIYIKDQKMTCNKNIWRSQNKKYIVFWSGTKWVLTNSIYEKEIGRGSGGILSIDSQFPYNCEWAPNVTSQQI